MTDITGWGSLDAPYSQEAEEATLGAIIVNPNTFTGIAAITAGREFFILRHRYVWEAIERLHDRGEPIDYLTICQEIDAHKQLGEIGGAAYITRLINSTPTSAHGKVYAGIVNAFSTRRRMLDASDSIRKLALTSDITVEDALAQANNTLQGASQSLARKGESISIHDSAQRFWNMIDERYTNTTAAIGISTGYAALDEQVTGLMARELTIIGGRPSMGKTAIGLNLMYNAAIQGRRCWMSSQEMSEEKIMARLVGIHSRIDTRVLERGRLTAAEYKRFVAAQGFIASLPISIDYTRGMKPSNIYQKCEEQANAGGLDLVIIDGMYLMEDDTTHHSEATKYEAISRKSFILAGDFNVPVLLLHQLNRGVELRPNKRPLLSDLREAGEQPADNVWLMYRDEYYNEKTERPGTAEVIIAKQRTGPVGTVPLCFQKTTTRFTDAVEAHIDYAKLNGHSAMPRQRNED